MLGVVDKNCLNMEKLKNIYNHFILFSTNHFSNPRKKNEENVIKYNAKIRELLIETLVRKVQLLVLDQNKSEYKELARLWAFYCPFCLSNLNQQKIYGRIMKKSQNVDWDGQKISNRCF